MSFSVDSSYHRLVNNSNNETDVLCYPGSTRESTNISVSPWASQTWEPAADGDWFQWKFLGLPRLMPVINLLELSAYYSNGLRTFNLYGSQTGAFAGEETLLLEVVDAPAYTSWGTQRWRFINDTAYRHIRVVLLDYSSSNRYCANAIAYNSNVKFSHTYMGDDEDHYYCGGSWGVDLCTSGTPSNSNETATTNAFDNSTGTALDLSWNDGYNWIEYDFGAGNGIVANKFTFYPYSTGFDFVPDRIIFVGSNTGDFLGEETILLDAGNLKATKWVPGTLNHFYFNNEDDFRYYRWYFADLEGSNGEKVYELEILHCTEIPHDDSDLFLEEESLTFDALETYDLDVDSLTFDDTESIEYTPFMGYTENFSGVPFVETESFDDFEIFQPAIEDIDPFNETETLTYFSIAYSYVDFAGIPFVETESMAETDEGITAYGAAFEAVETLEYNATVILDSEPFIETESIQYNFTELLDSEPFVEPEELVYTAAISQAMPVFEEVESLEYVPVRTGQITADNDLPFIELETRFGMLADNDLPFVELEAQLQPFHTITASQDLPFIDLEATLLAGKLITADNDLPFIEVSGQIVNTNVLSCSQDLPFVELDAMIATQNIITADNDLPFFDIRAMITGSQTRFAPATAVLKHTRW